MSAESIPFNTLLVLLSLVAGVALLRSRVTKSDLWHATLTPLSSIIGSGFLIMAPLLASIVGPLSPIAIVGIVLIAFSAGHVIRFNIRYLEPRLAEGRLLPGTRHIEQLGNLVLAFAYVVAVAFYLSLLSSFLLNYFGVSSLFLERSLTTSIIVFITTVGYLRGLGGLERLEAFSVNIQLAVIASLMVGLVLFSISFYSSSELDIQYTFRPIPVQFQMLAGALLIVQGFETSRFLGDSYSQEIRVKSSRNAQIISGILYVGSVALLMPVVQSMDLHEVKLAEIVQAMTPVALVLPAMLMLAAIMSQFSAAVADLGGGGGLLREGTRERIATRFGYIFVSAFAVGLVWTVDLLEIVAIASKAFASYYLLQTILAIIYNRKDRPQGAKLTVVNEVFFSILALILAYIVVFSISAE